MEEYKGKFQEGSAAKSVISLSQVLLAPLNAIFKAQIHGARSFLNLILQLGFSHQEVDEGGEPREQATDQLYYQEFPFETIENGVPIKRVIKVPVLALIPVHPLSVEEANFQVNFKISHIYKSRQIQSSEDKALANEDKKYDAYHRPWFLIDDPISIRGVLANKPDKQVIGTEDSEESTITINVKISRQAMPAGFEKLMTTLTQTSSITNP